MQISNLFFLVVVLAGWVFVVKCFKTMHWHNILRSLVQTLGNQHPVVEQNIAEEWVSNF
jgi:hypothetical protein